MSGQNLQAFVRAGLPVVSMDRFKKAIVDGASAAKAIASSGGLLLRLGRDGLWVYGPDSVEVQEGSQWAINPYSISLGFAAWGEKDTKDEGTLLGERMALIYEPSVSLANLPDVGASWLPQVQFDLVCLNGDDTGTEVRYKTTSVGGRRAFSGTLDEVKEHANGDGQIVPVVALAADSYIHKKYGKTYVPVFEVTEWKAPDDTSLGEPVEGDDAATTKAETPAEPVQQRPRRAAATAAPANEKPAGRQRRGAVSDVTAQPSQAQPATAPPAAVVDRGAVVRRRRAVA